MALVVASAIGLALLSNVIPTLEATAPKDYSQTHRVTQAFVRPIRLKGDPIDDPRPNTIKL